MGIRSAQPRTAERCRVLIVDDHPIVRRGLGQLIDRESDMELIGEADSPSSALDAVEALSPHVVVADLSFEGLDGIELIKDLRARHPGLPVLVLSMHDESFYAQRVLKAGAMGYLMKQEGVEQVVDGIRSVREGRVFLSNRMSQALLSRMTGGSNRPPTYGVESLTDRELEVLRLIGQGRSTRQIAEQLHLSIKTIETHRENIKQKLRLENASQLMQYAVRFAIEPT
ncbi:response regulator [Phycisphaerales bacterium AB-hyl4]|uniref:Response regulator n=1 Tax=Natronomicrosphaera hydrolytica TaxID=3242702 RepID=A0ABV4U239_9BACT